MRQDFLISGNAVDRPSTILAFSGLTSLFILYFNLMPLVVESARETLHWSDSQLGGFASLAMLGGVVASLAAPFWIRIWPWRRIMFLACLSTVVFFWLVPLAPGYGYSGLCIFLASMSAMTGFSPAVAAFSDSLKRERNFALVVGMQVVLSSVVALLLGSVQPAYGFTGVMGTVAMFTLMGLVLIPLCTDKGVDRIPAETQEEDASIAFPRLPVLLGLFSLFAFYFGLLSIWAFAGAFGEKSGLTDEQIAYAISLSLLLGAGGAFLAGLIGGRIPPWLGAGIGCTGVILSSFGLWYGGSMSVYVFSVAFLNAAWNFTLPYSMGLVSSLDYTGRYSVLMMASLYGGGAVGPILAGVLLENFGFGALTAGGSAVVLLSWIVLAVTGGLASRMVPMTKDGDPTASTVE